MMNLKDILVINPEIQKALVENRPVVAVQR